MRVALLGFTVPDQLLARIHATDELPQSQTHRFAWALVRALRDNRVDVDLLSTAPVMDFPRNSQVLFGFARFDQDGVSGVLLPFVNLTVLKHLTRFLSCWFVAAPRLHRSRPDWLVVHGVHSPFLWFAVMARRRIGVRTAVILTDPPGVVRPDDGTVKRLLKRLDVAVVRSALVRCDAVVVLAEPLAHDFAPRVPYLVLEGLAATTGSPAPLPTAVASGPTVVYAGGLLQEYGVGDLVRAFRALPDPTLRLQLYGRGALEPWLAEQSVADPRIQPVRLVAPEELGGIYAHATVLVQPRPAEQDFVPYSFPSKLIEYLASGTVTVSTRLPTIPDDYEPHVVWSEGGAEGLARALTGVLGWSRSARAAHGAAASRFVTTSRGTTAQGARLVAFLEETAGR